MGKSIPTVVIRQAASLHRKLYKTVTQLVLRDLTTKVPNEGDKLRDHGCGFEPGKDEVGPALCLRSDFCRLKRHDGTLLGLGPETHSYQTLLQP